jgi:hypothetical protein
VTLPFDTSPDEQPPTVTARAPVPGAVDVDVATDVTVQFDEPVDADGIAGLVTLRAAGAPTDVAATVVVDGAVVTLDPSDDLAPSTEYDVTVSGAVTDVAGNPLGADDTWSFTTSATLTYLVDETDGDFGAGTTGAGTYVSRSGDGEVVLAPAVGAEFEGDVVPAGWTTSSWGGGSSTVVAGGSVTVDGERLSSDPLHPAGRSMEFVATFGAASFQHVGFGVDYDSVAAWAMFSTHNTGGSVLYARTHDGGAASNVPIGNLVGSPHHYRIDWLPGSVVFRVDGVVVHTETVTIATDMRPLVSDFSGGGAVLSLDWLRMGPYASAGTFTSRVLDAGAPVEWRTLDVTGATPAGSSAAFEVRTGGTTDPDDGSWSAFAPVADGADIPGTSRYAQYRVALSTSDPATTPVVERVALGSVALGPLPVVTGGAGVVVEGDSGTTTLVIPVTLSAPAGHEVTVAWSTIPSGDPVPGVDYETAGGTLTFEPGETEQHVEVTVLGDVLDEPGVFFGAEWLFVGLTPTGATLGSDFFAGVAHGFIVDDDPQPTIVGGIGSVVEGDAGTVTLQIPVTLSAPSAATVSVAWATAVSPGLVAGVDFEAASGTVTFAPGDTEEVVSITVHGDEVDEPGVVFGAEWLFLQLSSPVHASFGSGFFATVAHGFIVDDD